MTPIVAVFSEKGGVAKSATTTGLAAVAGARGHDVLVIDMDPRATATDELGVENPAFSTNDLLYVDTEAEPVDVRGLAAEAVTAVGEAWPTTVRLIPAERALARRESDPTTGMEHRLGLSLDGVAEKYDLVVIDVPPRAGGKLAGAALIAATHVLIPATLDEDGRIGVREAITSIGHIRAGVNPRLGIVGILRSIVAVRRNELRTVLAREIDTWLTETYPDLVLPVMIPEYNVRRESRFARVPITAVNTAEARALVDAYGAVADVVLGGGR